MIPDLEVSRCKETTYLDPFAADESTLSDQEPRLNFLRIIRLDLILRIWCLSYERILAR